MKKTLNILLGFAAAFAVFSCTDKEIYYVYPEYGEDRFIEGEGTVSSDNPYFTVTDEGGEVAFKTKGGEVVLNVNCYSEWTAEVSEVTKSDGVDWLDVDVDYDYNTLTITVGQNTEPERNTAIIELMTVADNAVFSTITVTQNAAGTPEITAEQNMWNAPAVGVLTTEIEIETTFDEYTVETACTWLLVEKMDNAVRLTVDPNEETEERSTEVTLTSSDGVDSDSDVILVTQDGAAYISLSTATLTFYETTEAKLSSTTVESNFDWDFSYDKSNGWFTISRDGEVLTAAVTVENDAEENRVGEVVVTAGDGLENTTEVILTVTQLGMSEGSLVLIYTTTANSTEIQLPLSGTVDCTVDWGDGSEESITTTLPTHTYELAGEYFVSIKGTVTALNSNSIKAATSLFLTGIKQWGDTGLTSLDHAFYNCKNLEYAPADEIGSFSEVTTAADMFYNCGSATSGTTIWGEKDYMPDTATGLTEVSPDLFQYATKCESFSETFMSCFALKEVPAGLFRNCESATSFYKTFWYDINIYSVPDGMLDGCPKVTTVYGLFCRNFSLESIPQGLFDNCPDITTMYCVFEQCFSLKDLPEGIFDKNVNVTNFGEAFYQCLSLGALQADLFKNNTKVTTFSSAFKKCAFTSLPEGLFDGLTAVTSYASAFEECPLESVPENLFKDSGEVTSVSKLFYNTKLSTVPSNLFGSMDKCTNISYLFAGCVNMTSVPDGVLNCFPAVTNASYLFDGCTGLTSIPDNMFQNNSKITNLDYAFRNCTSLTEIPAGMLSYTPALTEIKYGFYGCTGLTEIPTGMFNGCSSLSDLSYTFYGCTGITTIGEEAFANMTSLTTLADAFYNCTGIKTIGKKAFYGNTALTTIASAFNGCTGLETIGESAFEGCKALGTATSVFAKSSNLKSVGARAFADCTVNTSTSTPSFANLFQNCTALTSVGSELFAGCTMLK
ncbi:MAG: leucine-rich repeat protein, partial [Bacteroidales bacterium]|nr:leucine-rich repeat protein [Bacteroidales bacterium]